MITFKEFQTGIEEINKKRQELDNEEVRLSEEYVKSLPFVVGDKICVNDNQTYWVRGIEPHSFTECVNLRVVKSRKDGTPSILINTLYFVEIKDIKVIDDD